MLEPRTRMPRPWSAPDEAEGVRALELGVGALLALEAEPDPGDAEAHELVVRVLPERVRRAEDVERPRLAVLAHPLQQPQGALAVEEEVLVHHEEGARAEGLLEAPHDLEQLVPALVEAEGPALAPEHGRGRAEVAAERAADRRDHGGGRLALALAEGHAHRPRAEGGHDVRVADRRGRVLAEEGPEPRDALARDHVVGVDHLAQPRPVGDVAAHHDRGLRLVAAHDLAHQLHLADVRQDAADPDDVVRHRS